MSISFYKLGSGTPELTAARVIPRQHDLLTRIEEARSREDFIGVLVYSAITNNQESSEMLLEPHSDGDVLIYVNDSKGYRAAIPCFAGSMVGNLPSGTDDYLYSSARYWVGSKILNYWTHAQTGKSKTPIFGIEVTVGDKTYVVANQSLTGPANYAVFDMAKRAYVGQLADVLMDELNRVSGNETMATPHPEYQEGQVYRLTLRDGDAFPTYPKQLVWKYYERNSNCLVAAEAQGNRLINNTWTIFGRTGIMADSNLTGEVTAKNWKTFYTDDPYVYAAMCRFYPANRFDVITYAQVPDKERSQLGHPCMIRIPEDVDSDKRFSSKQGINEWQHMLYLGDKRLMREYVFSQDPSIKRDWASKHCNYRAVVNLYPGEMALCADLIDRKFSDVDFDLEWYPSE